ncbi:SipW-dependent-type signal peptide-containing protein [Paenarthrobacter ilicis]|uniref:SipW-dependent-type signal peptide-containing protein n=1 Tax=Paenarthrobacter ilicis TaxID=43665 RepID=UPI003870A962
MGRRAANHRGATLLRLRAVLAGALVLGVGSSVTLAAWTDSDHATGSFGTSVFATESTAAKPYVASGPWAANDTVPGATLLFQATGMSPGTASLRAVRDQDHRKIRCGHGGVGGSFRGQQQQWRR